MAIGQIVQLIELEVSEVELEDVVEAGMERDLQEAKASLEDAMRDCANMGKNCKMAQGLIVESNQKLDEQARALNDADYQEEAVC